MINISKVPSIGDIIKIKKDEQYFHVDRVEAENLSIVKYKLYLSNPKLGHMQWYTQENAFEIMKIPKKGDDIKIIDVHGAGWLKVGSTYKVLDVEYRIDHLVLKLDDHTSNPWSTSYDGFKIIKKEKLFKVLTEDPLDENLVMLSDNDVSLLALDVNDGRPVFKMKEAEREEEILEKYSMLGAIEII